MHDEKKQLIGMTTFIVFFVGIIPYFLLKKGKINYIEGYIPNISTIAAIISYHAPPAYFKYLYNPNLKSKYGTFSQNVINITAMLGIAFFISYYTIKYGNILSGWARAAVMIPLFFLIPSDIVNRNMIKIHNYIDDNEAITNTYLKNGFLLLFGVMCIIGIIVLEDHIINYLSNSISMRLSKMQVLKNLN